MKKSIFLRVLYTFCFTALCLIDQLLGSQTGRVQFIATNLTGVVIAVIILSGYKIKNFLKPVYAIWTGLMCIFVPVVLIYGEAYPYKGKLITALINIVLYGFIVIRVVEKQIIDKQYSEVRWGIFTCWICMIGLMIASRYEGAWPLWFGAMFGSFYLTDYCEEQRDCIFKSVADGIILGFLIIQGLAFVFRPYDTLVRYNGLYLNANMNALFYILSYCAFLCKWIIVKKEKKNVVLRIACLLSSGAMYGFAILTGAKTAILTMAIVTFAFLVCFVRLSKKKILSFSGCVIAIGIIAFVSIPVTYMAVRYIPTVHLHPIYFEGEWSEYRIQPGESRDSEKYITFNQLLDNNVGRILWFIDFDKESKFDKLIPCMQVYAEEVDSSTIEKNFIFTDEESAQVSPFKLRYVIHKHYYDRLNLVGHTTEDDGVAVTAEYSAPHAHNWILQMAFWFGIPVGILMIIMCVLYVAKYVGLLQTGNESYACILGCFVTAFVVFGMFEIDWRIGQFPFTLFFLLFYLVVNKGSVKK
ncbi:MAG: hypothetical protein K5669_02365 [Lachnospiraceae bacterium]|nr:hypothetical protein [Lachnospiraceae bacterium]